MRYNDDATLFRRYSLLTLQTLKPRRGWLWKSFHWVAHLTRCNWLLSDPPEEITGKDGKTYIGWPCPRCDRIAFHGCKPTWGPYNPTRFTGTVIGRTTCRHPNVLEIRKD